MRQLRELLCNRYQHVDAYRNLYLCLHCVLVCAAEGYDTQMLLDPFEKQFDLPTLAVQIGDHLRLQNEVVGQKCNAIALLVAHHHTTTHRGIVFVRVKRCQHARLIAQHVRAASVHWAGRAPFELRIAFGASDEELIQTRKILNFVIALMDGNAAAKRTQGQMREGAKDRQSDIRHSSRDQAEKANSANKSLTYDGLR